MALAQLLPKQHLHDAVDLIQIDTTDTPGSLLAEEWLAIRNQYAQGLARTTLLDGQELSTAESAPIHGVRSRGALDADVRALVEGGDDESLDTVIVRIQARLRNAENEFARSLARDLADVARQLVHGVDDDDRALALDTLVSARSPIHQDEAHHLVRELVQSESPDISFTAIACCSALPLPMRVELASIVRNLLSTLSEDTARAAQAFLDATPDEARVE